MILEYAETISVGRLLVHSGYEHERSFSPDDTLLTAYCSNEWSWSTELASFVILLCDRTGVGEGTGACQKMR